MKKAFLEIVLWAYSVHFFLRRNKQCVLYPISPYFRAKKYHSTCSTSHFCAYLHVDDARNGLYVVEDHNASTIIMSVAIKGKEE